MDFEILIKYLIWIAVFIIAIGGIYLVLGRLGII